MFVLASEGAPVVEVVSVVLVENVRYPAGGSQSSPGLLKLDMSAAGATAPVYL